MQFVISHKDFDLRKPVNKCSIYSCKQLENDYDVPVLVADNKYRELKHSLCEGYMMYDIYLKSKAKWIGINHYRRIWHNPTEELTLPKPMIFPVNNQYMMCHNIDDLRQCEEIIDEFYPEYHLDWDGLGILFGFNMSILTKELYDKYIEFVFGVLDRFCEKNGLYSDEDVRRYVEGNKEKYNGSFDIDYQSRLLGFLMERIGTIFFVHEMNNNNFIFRDIHLY